MAQGTGDKRLIAPIAKSASAGVILALALAVPLLAGCGGDSDDPQAAAGTTATTAQAKAKGAAPASAGKAGAPRGGPDSKDGQGAPAGQGGQGAKHGPRIAQPSGPTEQAPTPEQIANATVADMTLQSPAITASGGDLGRVPATYTCDGKNSWPALRWGGVPPGTAELALFLMNVQPVEGQIFVDWAVAGLGPGLEGIEAGRLPAGAVVGTNGFGARAYSLCPQGAGETYMFALYALPQRLSPRPGFDALALRAQVLDVSGNVGFLPAVYARG